MKPKRLSYHHGEIGIDIDTYNKEIENISKSTRLQIYDTICNIIKDPESFDVTGEEKQWIDTYQVMKAIDGIKFYYTKKNKGWQTNAWSVVVEVDDKKYFCKLYRYKGSDKYSPYKDPAREFSGIDHTSQAWYKTLKPLIYYKNNDFGVIVYPYVEDMKTVFDAFVGNKIEKEERDKHKAYIDQASNDMDKVKVKDIKLENTYIDKNGDLVFFDTIFTGRQNSRHRPTERAEDHI